MIRYSWTFRIRNKRYLKIEHVCMCVEGILLTAFDSLRSYYNRHGRGEGSVLQGEATWRVAAREILVRKQKDLGRAGGGKCPMSE